jgi:hypothetical protein
MQREVLRVTPLAGQGIAPLVPPLIDALAGGGLDHGYVEVLRHHSS